MNKFENFNENEIENIVNQSIIADVNIIDDDIKLTFKRESRVMRMIALHTINSLLNAHFVQRVIDEPESSDKSVKIEDKYTLKKLPDGKVWMMENLRESVEGAKWSDEYNCYYYTWEQAKQAVPEGYHLPSVSDFFALCESLGFGTIANDEVIKKLQDECGFALAGCYVFDDERFFGQGSYAYYWSSTAQSATNAYYLFFNLLKNARCQNRLYQQKQVTLL